MGTDKRILPIFQLIYKYLTNNNIYIKNKVPPKMKKIELPKISPKAAEINSELEKAGPLRVSVYPDVLTRRPLPIDVEREEAEKRKVG
jgi:hypothetical protein